MNGPTDTSSSKCGTVASQDLDASRPRASVTILKGGAPHNSLKLHKTRSDRRLDGRRPQSCRRILLRAPNAAHSTDVRYMPVERGNLAQRARWFLRQDDQAGRLRR